MYRSKIGKSCPQHSHDLAYLHRHKMPHFTTNVCNVSICFADGETQFGQRSLVCIDCSEWRFAETSSLFAPEKAKPLLFVIYNMFLWRKMESRLILKPADHISSYFIHWQIKILICTMSTLRPVTSLTCVCLEVPGGSLNNLKLVEPTTHFAEVGVVQPLEDVFLEVMGVLGVEWWCSQRI